MLLQPNKRQARKLRRLVTDAKSNVPIYERLYADIDRPGRGHTAAEILSELPILSKSDLLAAPLEERIDRRLSRDDLVCESTTGSTGQPFTLCIDKSYIRQRNLRFLRGLLSAGYRPWQRLMLLTDRHADSTRSRLNRHYVSIEQPSSSILSAYQEIRPQVLYGLLTPLRLLAKSLPLESPRPNLVISTAEMLDPGSRREIETAFDCPVYDFYGMTEMGLVAWQRPGAERYIMSSDSVLTELVPDSGSQDRYRMIMTNLDLHASPMIRFDSGDLATVEWIDGEPQITAFEGRSIDIIVGPDGSDISPYKITLALQNISGLNRFKITQRSLAEIQLEVEAEVDQQPQIAQSARTIFEELLGTGVNIDIRFRRNLMPEGSRKFRPVESHVRRP